MDACSPSSGSPKQLTPNSQSNETDKAAKPVIAKNQKEIVEIRDFLEPLFIQLLKIDPQGFSSVMLVNKSWCAVMRDVRDDCVLRKVLSAKVRSGTFNTNEKIPSQADMLRMANNWSARHSINLLLAIEAGELEIVKALKNNPRAQLPIESLLNAAFNSGNAEIFSLFFNDAKADKSIINTEKLRQFIAAFDQEKLKQSQDYEEIILSVIEAGCIQDPLFNDGALLTWAATTSSSLLVKKLLTLEGVNPLANESAAIKAAQKIVDESLKAQVSCEKGKEVFALLIKHPKVADSPALFQLMVESMCDTMKTNIARNTNNSEGQWGISKVFQKVAAVIKPATDALDAMEPRNYVIMTSTIYGSIAIALLLTHFAGVKKL